MPWIGPVEQVQANSSTSLSTYLFTSFSAVIPAGTLVALGICANNAGITVSSCADNSSQSGSANSYTIRPAKSSNVLNGFVIWCVTTRQIQTSDTITVTLSATQTRRSGYLVTFRGEDAAPFDVAAGVNSKTTSPVATATTQALAGSGELALMFSFWKGGAVLSGVTDSGTGYTLTTASAGSGGTSSRVETNVSYKTSATAAGETGSHSFTSITAGCAEVVTFKLGAVAQSGMNYQRRGLGPVFA